MASPETEALPWEAVHTQYHRFVERCPLCREARAQAERELLALREALRRLLTDATLSGQWGYAQAVYDDTAAAADTIKADIEKPFVDAIAALLDSLKTAGTPRPDWKKINAAYDHALALRGVAVALRETEARSLSSQTAEGD